MASSEDWTTRLAATGPLRDEAIAELHRLMLRAARHRVSRIREARILGAAWREEIIHSAANEATVSVLSRLHEFEGRSRFTTWAYKFGILHAGVAVRRAAWSSRDIPLHEIAEPAGTAACSPEACTEYYDLAEIVMDGVNRVLTRYQRIVAIALLLDDVPISVLADRLGTNRGALYKTLHEARKRLRRHLADQGYTIMEEQRNER